jgi:hypothetical protein
MLQAEANALRAEILQSAVKRKLTGHRRVADTASREWEDPYLSDRHYWPWR